jgi:gamma-tubulin complex component 4
VNSLESLVSKMFLEVEDEWPLHVLFTPEAVNKYNELFRFLLQVRRLQMDLNLLWINTRKVFRFPVQKGPAELRNVMSYFIDHLQHYLQVLTLRLQFPVSNKFGPLTYRHI